MAKYLDLNGLGIIAGRFKELQPGKDGQDGATFTPAVSADGTLTWTNDRSLPNPDPVNIRGPQGPQGPTGPRGATGARGPQGETGPALMLINGTPLIVTHTLGGLLSALKTLSTEMATQVQGGEYPTWGQYVDGNIPWSPMWHIYYDSTGIYEETGGNEASLNDLFSTFGADFPLSPITAALLTVTFRFTQDRNTPCEQVLLDVLVRPVSFQGVGDYIQGTAAGIEEIQSTQMEYYLLTLVYHLQDGIQGCAGKWLLPWETF